MGNSPQEIRLSVNRGQFLGNSEQPSYHRDNLCSFASRLNSKPIHRFNFRFGRIFQSLFLLSSLCNRCIFPPLPSFLPSSSDACLYRVSSTVELINRSGEFKNVLAISFPFFEAIKADDFAYLIITRLAKSSNK